ncbi:hypothetical protein JCM5296_004902 [Sporobolomyces johnsonii]
MASILPTAASPTPDGDLEKAPLAARGGTLRARRDGDRTAKLAAVAIAVLLGLWVMRKGLAGTAMRQAQQQARSQQHLVGFSETRLDDLPAELRIAHDLPLDDLIGHSLLAHPTPTCRLNTFQQDRYAPLLPSYGSGRQRRRGRELSAHDQPRHYLNYFIAINLYDSSSVIPSLVRALRSLLTSLGPTRFHVSIYENGSNDATPKQLYVLAALLKRLGAGFTIVSDAERQAGWKEGGRIEGLAELRNLALKPLYDAPPGTFDRVLFLNDVHLCEADLLELLFQHEVQSADMSCGMDFKALKIKEFEAEGYPLLFYDVWVARDMEGLPFYEIEYPKGDWVLPSPVMPRSASRFRYDSLLPIQVYSCFNGVTVLDASLFAPPHSIRFRSQDRSDIHSECYLVCSDIWKALSPLNVDGSPNKHGRGARIQVVPRASVGYEVDEYEGARKDRNTTAFEYDGAERAAQNEREMVEWEQWPPRLVTTYPYGRWDNQISIPPF